LGEKSGRAAQTNRLPFEERLGPKRTASHPLKVAWIEIDQRLTWAATARLPVNLVVGGKTRLRLLELSSLEGSHFHISSCSRV
jgi:hypothetical protein